MLQRSAWLIFIFTDLNEVTKQIKGKLQSSSQYLPVPCIETKQVKIGIICWHCFVFQELCEEVFLEGVNVESSNIISNDFVDHKPEKNETLDAITKNDNKSSTQSYNKFGGHIKLLEMYIINKLKFQILQQNVNCI